MSGWARDTSRHVSELLAAQCAMRPKLYLQTSPNLNDISTLIQAVFTDIKQFSHMQWAGSVSRDKNRSVSAVSRDDVQRGDDRVRECVRRGTDAARPARMSERGESHVGDNAWSTRWILMMTMLFQHEDAKWHRSGAH